METAESFTVRFAGPENLEKHFFRRVQACDQNYGNGERQISMTTITDSMLLKELQMIISQLKEFPSSFQP